MQQRRADARPRQFAAETSRRSRAGTSPHCSPAPPSGAATPANRTADAARDEPAGSQEPGLSLTGDALVCKPQGARTRFQAGSRLIGATGFEPATFRPPAGCATRLRHAPMYVPAGLGTAGERATGLEPAPGAWKAPVQPLHHARGRRPIIGAAPAASRIAAGGGGARIRTGIQGFGDPANSRYLTPPGRGIVASARQTASV
jgi:hypothetical protein